MSQTNPRIEEDSRLEKRIAVYKAIEKYRKRPLIVYATSTRSNVRAHLAADAVREFVDQVQAIKQGEAVDVLLHSYGGDSLAAWRIMSMLRERFDKVGVLVPYAAFSAATVLALGADQIVMHPFAALGPIDPQIEARTPKGEVHFAYEDVGAFLRFIKEQVGLTEQTFLTPVLEKLFAAAEPLMIGAAQRASDLASEIGERMLRMHMTQEADMARCKDIARNLNKSFFSHGDAVSRDRAKILGLPIAPADEKLEALLWDAYLGLEDLMELNSTFNPLAIFMSDPAAAATLRPGPHIALPSNTPPQMAQQAWNHVITQALTGAGPGPEVPFRIVKVVVESVRRSAAIVTEGTITAARVGQGIEAGAMESWGGWMAMRVPPKPAVRSKAKSQGAAESPVETGDRTDGGSV